MGTKKTLDLPARLEGVRGRFERWRQTRKVGTRIPEALWAAAVKMAGTYGVHRTAKTLRVNYYALNRATGQRGPSPDLVALLGEAGFIARYETATGRQSDVTVVFGTKG